MPPESNVAQLNKPSEFSVIAGILSEKVENFANLQDRLRKVSNKMMQRPEEQNKPGIPQPIYGGDVVGALKQGLHDIGVLEQKIREDINFLESLVG